jgi:hypothetical protein
MGWSTARQSSGGERKRVKRQLLLAGLGLHCSLAIKPNPWDCRGGVAAKDRREPATEGAVAQRARLVGEEGLLNGKWWTSSYGCGDVKKKQRQGWRADLGGRGDCFDSGVVGSERGGWRAHSPIL